MGAEDLAFIEDAVLRAIQKKTGPRWAQQYHSQESIKEAIDRTLKLFPPAPRSDIWYTNFTLGNDTTGDGGEDKPYKTINKSVTEAAAHDTIILIGSFDEALILAKLGLRILGLGRSNTQWTKTGASILQINTGGDQGVLSGIRFNGSGAGFNPVRLTGVNDYIVYDNEVYTPAANGIMIESTLRCKLLENKIHGITNSGISVGGAGGLEYNEIIGNTIQSSGYGIRINNANAKYNDIHRNKIWNVITGYGIEILAGSVNFLTGNWINGATKPSLKSIINNYFEDNHFSDLATGTHTTTGVAEETVLTETCVQPNTRLTGYLRLNNMVAGDNYTFRVKKSYNSGVTWDIIDETNLVGVQTIARYNYDLTLEVITEGARVTIQRNGAVDRAFYHKRTKGDR